MQKYKVKLHRRVTDELEVTIAEHDVDADEDVMREVIDEAIDHFVGNNDQINGWADEEDFPSLKVRRIALHNNGDYVTELMRE